MDNREYNILNMLRGTSALLVLFYHFLFFFFAHQKTWSKFLQTAPLDLPQPFYLQFLCDFPLDFGHLAVGYFFLISGFLIHASLQRYDSLSLFLKHKVIRLWPTYCVCFSLGLLFVAIVNDLLCRPFPFTLEHLLACFFWVRDIFGYSLIDGATWTLEIQLKFYIFSILVWSIWKKRFLEAACLLTVILSCIIYILFSAVQDSNYDLFYLVVLFRQNIRFFMLILLGSCTYAFFKKEISTLKMFCLCGILVGCFISPLFSEISSHKIAGYLVGFFSFFLCIMMYGKQTLGEGKLSQLITWISKISYPLYIGHVLPGYMIMYYMVAEGYNVSIGIVLAFLYTFIMATVVHYTVEARKKTLHADMP